MRVFIFETKFSLILGEEGVDVCYIVCFLFEYVLLVYTSIETMSKKTLYALKAHLF